MTFPFELELALRYLRFGRGARGNGFISFISLASILGIALGVAALIIVLSVMNGFQTQVRERMLSVLTHLELVPRADEPLRDWQSLAAQLRQEPHVLAVAPGLGAQALLARGETVRGVMVQGVMPEQEQQISPMLAEDRATSQSFQRLTPGGFGVVLGEALASRLEVARGDRVTLILPSGTLSPGGLLPRFKTLRVAGVFSSGHYEFDSSWAFVHLQDAQTLLHSEGPTALRLRLDNIHNAPLVRAAIADKLDGWTAQPLLARDWSQHNRQWFAAVQLEKRMMFIILTLIVAVAAFNLVSMLVMSVEDKRSAIAILRTLGASPASIMALFVVEGSLAGALGAFSGLALGLLVAMHIDTIVPAIESLLHARFLPPEIYVISQMPSEPRAADIVPIVCIALLLAFLATLYPAWRAARLQPAAVLRYE